jgi:hypothetical protein
LDGAGNGERQGPKNERKLENFEVVPEPRMIEPKAQAPRSTNSSVTRDRDGHNRK